MGKIANKPSLAEYLARRRTLFLIVASICIIILVANLESRETTILVGNLLYIPVTFFMAASSFALLRKQRKIEDRDMGWVLFFGATVTWLVAEHVWIITELVLHGKTFPSAADFFYIGGYVLMGAFIFRMLWPLKSYVSSNIKVLATLIVSVFLVPSILTAYSSGGEDPLSMILSLAYPVMDGVLLWPGIIVLASSFKIKSGRFWTWISIGIISLLVGDTMFSYVSSVSEYYTGYPAEIFFYCAYIIFGYASLTRVRQALAHKPLLEEVREAFQGLPLRSRFSTWKTLLILSVSLVTTFVVLMVETDVTRHLTTNQLDALTPAGYAISGLIAIPVTILVFSRKKIHGLRSKIKEAQIPYEKPVPPETEPIVNAIQQLIYRQEQRQNMMMPFWTALVVALVVVSTYAITSTISETQTQNAVIPSGRFLLENLQGSTINTWVGWNAFPGQPLHVTIVNSQLVGSSKLQAVKDAILSKDTTVLKNSQAGQATGGSTTYYDGWLGALDHIHQQNSTIPIPTGFEINQSGKAVGDIVIILSTDTDSDGTFGFTKSIADAGNHQLLKSFITIFNVKNLSDRQIGDVVRHEFGHALGLGHSSDPNDLMYTQFHENLAYVSPCDMDALKAIYAGHGAAGFTCTT